MQAHIWVWLKRSGLAVGRAVSEAPGLCPASQKPAPHILLGHGYEVKHISNSPPHLQLLFLRHLDFISLMTYDFHGAWRKATGHHSPLFRGQADTGPDRFSNVVGLWKEYGRESQSPTPCWCTHSHSSLFRYISRKIGYESHFTDRETEESLAA